MCVTIKPLLYEERISAMIFEKIQLAPTEATLTALCFPKMFDKMHVPPRRAIIVCPGGGYGFCSDREADPIAASFLASGFATFVLHYSVKENAANYQPIKEVALAVKYVREHAEEYNVDPAYVFTCGFSAGGHLAASAGVLWNDPAVREVLGDAPSGINRPTGMILSYPVITAGEWAHRGSIANLCGVKEYTKEQGDRFSLELHVDETTSPAFIWHTFSDNCVPVQNSLLMAEAMTKANVPFELHIFPEGQHGLSLCNELVGTPAPHNACWIELAARWAQELVAPKE